MRKMPLVILTGPTAVGKMCIRDRLMLLTKGIDEVDLASFPKGRTLVAIAKKLHLLGR